MSMDGGVSPKLPTIFTGRESFRDSSAQVGFQAKLGLGSMAIQASNSVNISGGSITSLSSINSSYYYGSYSYISYLYPYLCAGNYITSYTLLDVQAAMQLKTVLHTADGQISDSETVVLCDAASAASCTGTPATQDCTTYSSQSPCESNSNHGGQCSWNGVYCPSYNGNQSTCEAYHCTWEMTSCAPYNSDQMTCESHSGCSWSPNYASCHTFDSDESGCTTHSGCSWTPATNANCTDFTNNYGSCTTHSGCSWTPVPQPCSNFNNNAGTCGSTTGCSWDPGGFDCHTLDGAGDATCTAVTGCAWNYGDNTCYGTCSGTYDDGSTGDCTGTYVSIPSDCSGTYPDGTGDCNGSFATGNCLSSGVEGYCTGTVTCGGCTDDGSSICNAESGCTWTTGINLILPPGSDGRTIRVQKVDSSGGTVVLTVYNTGYQYVRANLTYTLTTQWQDIWLTYYSSTSQWS